MSASRPATGSSMCAHIKLKTAIRLFTLTTYAILHRQTRQDDIVGQSSHRRQRHTLHRCTTRLVARDGNTDHQVNGCHILEKINIESITFSLSRAEPEPDSPIHSACIPTKKSRFALCYLIECS